MNKNFSKLKSIALAVTLVAGIAGVARADDSSMNPFTGDSYAYFNGGNLPQGGHPVIDNAPSAWRQSNPNGMSERVFQSYSAPGEEWHLNKPVFDNAPSSFAASNPHGLSERQMQALSSEATAWQSPTRQASTALASTNEPGSTKSAANEPPGTRIARFFHVSPVGDTTSTN
jgi:hypothetical protein